LVANDRMTHHAIAYLESFYILRHGRNLAGCIRPRHMWQWGSPSVCPST